MENWKNLFYETAEDYYLKDCMSNFLLARQLIIDKIENVLSPLKRIDENLYYIEDQSLVRVGNIEINFLTEFILPGRDIDTIRVVKRNLVTDEEELSVKIHINDNGGSIQYGDNKPEKVTEENIDLLLKHLLMDSFK
ncbi:hypothetical protein [Lysinibacillus xylanilyticus]|uniref:hypothetical protein n=1 Tax=Lysinibacillus xylanilyticus TaxID=582475 RepID=UPI00083C92E9|nr:hypothetical protein [Lysinibacillus xylanilyticus]